MNSQTNIVSSGLHYLDTILGGGIIIGDNVVWYDDAGSLASIFCLHLLKISREQNKALIYINFDHSPKNILEKLGPLADHELLTILDCFTSGKGQKSDVFENFYKHPAKMPACRIIRVEEPDNPDYVSGAFYGLQKTLPDDVRFVFDSLTGMQELWGGEDQILKFYSHACPRLYELNTIAYWIIEKGAHSTRLKAHLNKITQVAIDLTLKRGKSSLTVLKADKRELNLLNKPIDYWSKGDTLVFESEKGATSRLEIGARLKELRAQQGLSQTQLAKLVGVTPSTISQIESNLIYPSLPALIKISEVLAVDLQLFFQDSDEVAQQIIFPAADAIEIQLSGVSKETVRSKLLIPMRPDIKIEPYLIEIPPGAKVSSHFFFHKGQEAGYLLAGELTLFMKQGHHTATAGDTICLISDVPLAWKNTGTEPAKLLWIKVK
jgi:transcriptional regulator with XRE-family HTH domain/KaiC/GvpD/RAD55 family RecA-like ATPase